MCLQLIVKFLVHTRCTSALRFQRYDHSVLIVQQILTDQVLKISSIHLFLKKCKCVQCLDMNKRFIFIIEPAVHDLQTVHQTLRVTSVIRFSVLELMINNTCLQCFSVNAMLYHICKKLLDQCHKFFLLFRIRILRNYRKNWLIYAIVIGTQNILTDSCLQKRLLKRCSRC